MKGRARWAIATCGATLAVAGPVAFAAALQPRPTG